MNPLGHDFKVKVWPGRMTGSTHLGNQFTLFYLTTELSNQARAVCIVRLHAMAMVNGDEVTVARFPATVHNFAFFRSHDGRTCRSRHINALMRTTMACAK